MNAMKSHTKQSGTIAIVMMVVLAVLAGCERDEPTVETAETQPPRTQPAEEHGPLEHVVESDGYTLRANIGRTENLPDAMARQYGIERDPDLLLLNVVLLDNRSDEQPVPVPADVSAQIESLTGHFESIDMQEVESDGHVSYIGTLDASAETSFQLHIEAQRADIDQPLHINFEVNLETFDNGGSE